MVSVPGARAINRKRAGGGVGVEVATSVVPVALAEPVSVVPVSVGPALVVASVTVADSVSEVPVGVALAESVVAEAGTVEEVVDFDNVTVVVLNTTFWSVAMCVLVDVVVKRSMTLVTAFVWVFVAVQAVMVIVTFLGARLAKP